MSILTLYRPNFCSACGAKIIRLRWRLWTSRKFCNSCVPQFRKEHWLQPILAVIGLFGLGVFLGQGLRPTTPPLVIQRVAGPIAAANTGAAQTEDATSIEDDVYLCGARTKKGTPCSRRVHGPVRCWQHKGQKAMLPPDKLRIKD